MPLKSRLKRAFGRSSESSSSSASSSSSPQSLTTISSRRDSSVYQPGEPMPRPKYRAPVDRKHKALLDSYTFASATGGALSRKRSSNSLISPGGSKMPSRSPSFCEHVHPGPSFLSRQIVNDEGDEDLDPFEIAHRRRQSVFVAGPKDDSSPDSSIIGTPDGSDSKIHHGLLKSTTAMDHTPFTTEQLAHAMSKTGFQLGLPTLAAH